MTNRLLTLFATLGAAGLVMSGNGTASTHYIWNASASVPVGLYRLQWASKFGVPDLVASRPQEPLATFLADGGYLPRNVLLLKRVLAVAGQTVCRKQLVITVDGIEVGEARERDGRGRSLPAWQGCRSLGEDELFVMNWQSPDSLDGRYFGTIPKSSVIGHAIPIWTEEQ